MSCTRALAVPADSPDDAAGPVGRGCRAGPSGRVAVRAMGQRARLAGWASGMAPARIGTARRASRKDMIHADTDRRRPVPGPFGPCGRTSAALPARWERTGKRTGGGSALHPGAARGGRAHPARGPADRPDHPARCRGGHAAIAAGGAGAGPPRRHPGPGGGPVARSGRSGEGQPGRGPDGGGVLRSPLRLLQGAGADHAGAAVEGRQAARGDEGDPDPGAEQRAGLPRPAGGAAAGQVRAAL